MSNQEKTRLYIEALPLTTKHVSGIGHMLASIVRELSTNPEVSSDYEIVLFGPRSGEARIKAWQFENVTYAHQPLRQKIITVLNLLRILPPVDLWLGKGTYLFGNFVNYPLTKGSRSFTYVHDLSYIRFPELVRPKVRNVLKRNVPRWIKRSEKVIAVSEYTKSELMKFYKVSDNKIVVVPNGVDHKQFYKRTDSEVSVVKQKYSIPDTYVLFVSNLEPRKNLQRLVESYAALPEDLRAVSPLVVVGSESWLSEGINQAIVDAQTAGCNIVRPNIYVEDGDLPALYSGATLLAHPAIYEGFGISPLQAMACGTPVLAAKATSLPEVLGDAALYIDPESTADITAGLTRMLKNADFRTAMTAEGYAQSKEFSWEKTVEMLLREIK